MIFDWEGVKKSRIKNRVHIKSKETGSLFPEIWALHRSFQHTWIALNTRSIRAEAVAAWLSMSSWLIISATWSALCRDKRNRRHNLMMSKHKKESSQDQVPCSCCLQLWHLVICQNSRQTVPFYNSGRHFVLFLQFARENKTYSNGQLLVFMWVFSHSMRSTAVSECMH